MKKIRIILLALLLILAGLLVFNNKSFATIDPESIILRFAPDGKTATIKSVKPSNINEAQFMITTIVDEILREDGYSSYAYCVEPDYKKCVVQIASEDYESTWDVEQQKTVVTKGFCKSYEIDVTFDEPSEESATLVKPYLNKLKDITPGEVSTYYKVEDLSLINYYLTSDESELYNPGAASRAVKFTDVNEIIKNTDISFKLAPGAGAAPMNATYEEAFGEYSIFYNGYAYGCKTQGIYLKRVIYIPEDTEESEDAYIAAAQKRIDDYLENNSVKVSKGGLANTLDETAPDVELTETDGRYYNVKIGTRTYQFHIIKADSKKLNEPTYKGKNLGSDVEITSEDSSIPLDTVLTVKVVNDETIKAKIGTDNCKSYDISLYSDAKGAKIEKLSNGTFEVKIPVPDELKDKDITVYYIASDGTKEEHKVTVKDGYAVFTTNHFSVYTLAEIVESAETATESVDEEKDSTPKTGVTDISGYVLSLAVISGIGIIVLRKTL